MWARVDDSWWCHPKVMSLPLAARGLWVSALSWSCAQRRSGVPTSFLLMVGATPSEAAELVAAGLWDTTDDGYEIHDWAEYQDLSTSERRAIAGSKGGKRSGEARRSKAKQTPDLTSGNDEANRSQGEANAEAGPIPSHPDPALPVPSLPNDPAPVSGPLTTPAPDPLTADEIEQSTNRAVGKLANLRAIGGDNPGALARHIGENLPEHERAELRDLIAAGSTPEDAAAALADPLRGMEGMAPYERRHDPAELARVAEAAAKREAATKAKLAEITAAPERRMTRDQIRALRSVPDPAQEVNG